MFLFIFESIGTSELILIGIVALIFLGPRRMPEMARKLGKIMADFRGTANEFKATWEREVNFDEEQKALRLGDIEKEAEQPVARINSVANAAPTEQMDIPSIKEIDASSFKNSQTEPPPKIETEPANTDLNDKQNWL